MTRTLSIATLLAASISSGIWGVGSAAASDGCDFETYNHNGSRMAYENCGGAVELIYERPRSAMRRQGVGPGTTLFSGSIRGNRISGVAYRFKRGCGPMGYRVAGNFRRGGFTLSGESPIRGSGCSVTRYKRDRLRFN